MTRNPEKFKKEEDEEFEYPESEGEHEELSKEQKEKVDNLKKEKEDYVSEKYNKFVEKMEKKGKEGDEEKVYKRIVEESGYNVKQEGLLKNKIIFRDKKGEVLAGFKDFAKANTFLMERFEEKVREKFSKEWDDIKQARDVEINKEIQEEQRKREEEEMKKAKKQIEEAFDEK